LAKLGYKSMDEIIGRADLLQQVRNCKDRAHPVSNVTNWGDHAKPL